MDLDPLPEPTVTADEDLAQDWRWWWQTLLDQLPLFEPSAAAAFPHRHRCAPRHRQRFCL